MALPPVRAASGVGAGLSVLDYRSESLRTHPAAADGTMTAEFEPVPPGLIWLLERITVFTDSDMPTRAMVYAGTPSPQNFLDGSEGGNLDTADNACPSLIESNTPLTVQWTGATPGSIGTARIQYQLVSRT
jgi:hypothetical protein